MEGNTFPIMPVSDGANSSTIFMMLVFLLLAGGRGFGYGGGYGNGMITNDFAYTNLNNTLGQGFSAIQNTLGQGFTQVANQNFGLAKDVYQGFSQLSQCCCETNRNIDGIRAEIAGATGQITSNNDRNTQSILSAICDLKTSHLQEELQKAREENTVLRTSQNISNAAAYTVGALRQPNPVPAYVVQNPCAANSCCYNA